MLQNGFKMEVESLITKDISYVTETYLPGAPQEAGLARLSSCRHSVWLRLERVLLYEGRGR